MMVPRLRLSGAALLAPLQRSLASIRSQSRTRLLWLGGAIALIVIGVALAIFSPAPPTAQSVSTSINVQLPPSGGSGPSASAGPSRGPIGEGGSATVLAPAPVPGMIEDTPNGPLPIIDKNGREPWQVYARPFDSNDTRPRIALIVTGVGLDQSLSQAALDRLPGTITFGFDPYASNVKDSVANARNLGHEAMLGLPLEPLDYPRQDPGPLTLLTSLDPTQNGDRLAKLMGKATGYVGFVAIMGSRFEAESTSLLPLLTALKGRGLMFADDKAPEQSVVGPIAMQMKLPWAAGNIVIDSESDPTAIDQALAGLEASAKRNGVAIGIAALSPALLDRVAPWLATLDGKGIAIAPASAIANHQTAAKAAN
ncbi:MAG TPA: divergent polysaccharide deacetylase family protein [Stellaceae bacterium]|nr:divergent polysaccharide deacetylase family protein [Stellaceae bacterium]